MNRDHRLMYIRTRRQILRAATTVALLTVLTGCGYVYRADIQGRVVDADDDSGVNQATVRIYEEKPANPDSSGFIVRTETAISGGTTGVFQTGFAWREIFGEFGTEGDTTTLWAGVTHPDYNGTVAKLPGILSGENNTVGDITILSKERDEDANSAVVQGRVFEEVDGNREPVAGYEVLYYADEDDAGEYDEVDVSNDPDDKDSVNTVATGTFAVVIEWPEDSGIERVDLEFLYEDANGAEDVTRTITVEDGDNEFVRDVTLE
ncbi:MAG: hypothetical protein ACLFP4_12210 [Spirochaetales bacterium]